MFTKQKTKLVISRKNVSPYQRRDFYQFEKSQLESDLPVHYVLPSELLSEHQAVNIWITNTHTKPEDFSIEELENAKLIIHPNSGHDNFDVEFVKKLECPLILGNEIRAKAVSEYILACFFHAYSPPFIKLWDPNRQWSRSLFHQVKVQIIGYGHIGKILEKKFQSLEVDVSIYDPYLEKSELKINACDVLIFACSLNAHNHHFLNSQTLSGLKENVIIINGARGELIEWDSLLLFLDKHPRAKAYLDVFPNEPFAGEITHPQIFATSHIAGVHSELDHDIISFEKKVIEDFLADRDMFDQKWHHDFIQSRIKNDFKI